MSIARQWTSAFLLPDGRVLVAGGTRDRADARAEVYDPNTGKFSATWPMPIPDGYPITLQLPDGDVLIAGGSDELGNAVTSASVYHTVTGTLSPTGSMTTARNAAYAIPLSDGRVLIVGGTGDNGHELASAELYDPRTGSFSPTGSMTTPGVDLDLGEGVELLPGGKVLFAGGRTSDDNLLDSAELYDPATGAFTPTGSMNAPTLVDASVLLGDGHVLMIGYTGSAGGRDAEVYDPATGTFSAIGQTLDDYLDTATLLQDGRVLLTAGSSAELFVPGPG